MSDIDNPAIAAYETMKEKGYTPEEIETFLDYLERQRQETMEQSRELTLELIQPLVERMDYLELLFYWGYGGGFAILALLILIAPGALRDRIWKTPKHLPDS